MAGIYPAMTKGHAQRMTRCFLSPPDVVLEHPVPVVLKKDLPDTLDPRDKTK